MKRALVFAAIVEIALSLVLDSVRCARSDEPTRPKASIDGTGPGWRDLGKADFADVNGDPDTWSWNADGLHCTGEPVGVIRTQKIYTNFELSIEWRHLKAAGNSGVFVWATPDSIKDLPKGKLPDGIEVQVLDHGFTEHYEKQSVKKGDWFTTNGDVFAVRVKMKPFPPLSPDGSRSFPSQQLSRGVNLWNHYYVRAINGEIRLWVNGTEVSGGSDCDPRSGYLCLESEGSPIDFRHIRLRELP
jgi:Domain of Unknown Function (DUF1080)